MTQCNVIRAGDTVLKVGGPYLVTKEGPPWLGPMGKTFDFQPSRLAENASLEAINKG